MKKFEKVMLAAFVLLVVCLFITACTITPTLKANVTKIPTTEKTTLNTSSIKNIDGTSPIKNIDGSLTYNNVKPNVFNSMKQEFAEAGVQLPQ